MRNEALLRRICAMLAESVTDPALRALRGMPGRRGRASQAPST
ncbi:protein of unknown function (plasmid) [Azospirillum baldaniorum]|uniref:Uncharacterized protein n=1 Tax=Azospirillum baldaniorum TaxID=1064539 RepID=A0A9P1JVX0_9PROT|nr:protein of unknown function [Azospirillum baldaniorum]